jgi:hypothetical protein
VLLGHDGETTSQEDVEAAPDTTRA